MEPKKPKLIPTLILIPENVKKELKQTSQDKGFDMSSYTRNLIIEDMKKEKKKR